MGGKSKKGRKKSSRKAQTCSQGAVGSASTADASIDQLDKLFSRMAKFASKGKSIVKVEVRESNTFGHRTMEMVLTLFDGAVMTGCIPAIIESGDESFIRSYSERVIAPTLIGHDPTHQDVIDGILSQILDEVSKDPLSDKLKKLAKNVNWATSAAVCKAGAYANNMASYKYVRKLLVCYEPEYKGEPYSSPDCVFSITNGAMQPGITSAQQHLLIVHKEGASICKAIKRTKYIYDSYFKFRELYGQDKIAEDERSYAPTIQDIKKGLEELTKIIDHLGYKKNVSIGLDVGASQFYESNDSYRFRCKKEDDAHLISAKALNDVYISLLKEYNLEYIEDAFHHTNWKYFSELNTVVRPITTVTGEKWKLIWDHMLENPGRICTSLLLKVRKAGSVSELVKFVTWNKRCYITNVMDSHSCESNDPFIADLCVGLMVEQLKIGVSCITSNCKVCDQLNQIENEMARVRCLGFVGGRFELEINSEAIDEWDKPDYNYD